MGNINIITDKKGNVIGRADMGLASFSCVVKIAEKYNYPKPFPFVNMLEKINDYLAPVYEKAEPYEKVQVYCFINDKTTFTTEDIPAFKKAVENCLIQEEDRGPKKILRKIKELIQEHKEITLTYQNTYAAITVTKE